LELITVAMVKVSSGVPVYIAQRCLKPFPPFFSDTHVSLVDSVQCIVSLESLDPKLVKWVQRASKIFGIPELKHEIRKYTKKRFPWNLRKEPEPRLFFFYFVAEVQKPPLRLYGVLKVEIQ
jgi:hypothetical protein